MNSKFQKKIFNKHGPYDNGVNNHIASSGNSVGLNGTKPRCFKRVYTCRNRPFE